MSIRMARDIQPLRIAYAQHHEISVKEKRATEVIQLPFFLPFTLKTKVHRAICDAIYADVISSVERVSDSDIFSLIHFFTAAQFLQDMT